MLYTLIEIITLVDLGVIWIAFLYTLPQFKTFHPAFQYLFRYIGVIVLIESLAKMHIYEWVPGDNLYLFYVYMPLEFALLSLMYLKIFKRPHRKQHQMKILILLAFVLMLVLYFVFTENPYRGWHHESFEPISKLIVNGCMVGFSLSFFLQNLREPSRYLKHFKSLFYVNSAMLLYFAGTFIIYIFMKKMVEVEVEDTVYLWLLNSLLIFTFHVICIAALWQKDSRLMKTLPFG